MFARFRKFVLFATLGIACLLLLEQTLQCLEERKLLADQTLLTIGDNVVRYELREPQRPRKSPTVVVLNGMAASLEGWLTVVEPLSEDTPVLSYDRNGVGLSGLSDVRTANDQAEELLGLLDALELKEPVILVGYSFSCHMARVFAAKFPDRTAGVLLLDPALGEYNRKVPGRHTPFRMFSRSIIMSGLKSAFGIARLRSLFRDPPQTPEAARTEFTLRRSLHWLGALSEILEGTTQTREAVEAGSLGKTPLRVLCSVGSSPALHMFEETCRQVAGLSSAGRFVALPEVDHVRILAEPYSIRFVVDQIRLLTVETGASP